MTTAEHAATFIQAHLKGYIPSLFRFYSDRRASSCASSCDTCPASCSILSGRDGSPDYSVFIKNYAPVHIYLLQHHPELFI